MSNETPVDLVGELLTRARYEDALLRPYRIAVISKIGKAATLEGAFLGDDVPSKGSFLWIDQKKFAVTAVEWHIGAQQVIVWCDLNHTGPPRRIELIMS